jgi:hypothetical protein
LTATNTAIQCTGEKRSPQQDRSIRQDRDIFSKNWPLAKIRCFALMNVPYLNAVETVSFFRPLSFLIRELQTSLVGQSAWLAVG